MTKLTQAQKTFIRENAGRVWTSVEKRVIQRSLREKGMIEVVDMRYGIQFLLTEAAYISAGMDASEYNWFLMNAYSVAAKNSETNIWIKKYGISYHHQSDNIYVGCDVYEVMFYLGNLDQQSDWIDQTNRLWEIALKAVFKNARRQVRSAA